MVIQKNNMFVVSTVICRIVDDNLFLLLMIWAAAAATAAATSLFRCVVLCFSFLRTLKKMPAHFLTTRSRGDLMYGAVWLAAPYVHVSLPYLHAYVRSFR